MTGGEVDIATDIDIDFDTAPDQYRHWTLQIDGAVATLRLAVAEDGGLLPGYALKLNSYDLGVDIELYDAVQRLRFEHPEVRAVVMTGGLERMFCAGANIRMLAQSSHAWKVNFCKFTNETRCGIEDATAHSGQTWIAAVNGPAAGGGYELALACEHIVLVDDGSTTVSLPEVALLGVLPGTGGLTRLTDKRHVRRDRADVFATKTEGFRGATALEWGLVDAVAPPARFSAEVARVADDAARRSRRARVGMGVGVGVASAVGPEKGVMLTPLARVVDEDSLTYPYLAVEIDRSARRADFTLLGPSDAPPADVHAQGPDYWPLALTRALDDAILRLRTNEPEIGTWVVRTRGSIDAVAAYDAQLTTLADDWFVNEVRHYYKRTLKRLDMTSRSLVAVIDPGSCFVGLLLETALAADRQYMLDGVYEDVDPDAAPAALVVTASNLAAWPMANGLSRLATRFSGHEGGLEAAAHVGERLNADAAVEFGLVTYALDDLDFEDELRLALQERAALSPDALTGMEANLRFPGPETMETKIFGRLTAWQNWVFVRPNASGADGALSRYGSGVVAEFDHRRV
ncbi:benzoyl-CoA-dihydrodiol lyase [Catenulispora acidiphila DSM 44928]|uniref:Benzoyl-CoA-dihydrodiol lyase n=1 Tax=Catenulispora acidiphila (strain DSM 44928 / JCM 14897 / NBRC 102108 / NRRL B-24433 / ID139908) TaxID=479433 RepID=C7QFV1_CATAD|nr:2,3-epoxybenzoyl-CoA dihydrolase [Catenulispora acidiphila]ACU70928.1 benzoyl-CoA-dihydrodiol lyase [Catenulispora acidiphila DSM 44928]